MSVLKSLISLKHPSYLADIVLKIVSEVYNLQKSNHCVQFLWVPSHVGIMGNEVVDSFTRSEPTDTIMVHDFNHALQMLSNTSKNVWQNEWNPSTKGRYYHRIQSYVQKQVWCKNEGHNFSKSEINILTRAISGHNRTNQHLKRIGVTDSDLCECNMGIQTLDHLLWDCPHADRQHWMSFIHSQGYTPPYYIQFIFSNNPHTLFFKNMLNFIFKNNLII